MQSWTVVTGLAAFLPNSTTIAWTTNMKTQGINMFCEGDMTVLHNMSSGLQKR